jgi:hypothetical protein
MNFALLNHSVSSLLYSVGVVVTSLDVSTTLIATKNLSKLPIDSDFYDHLDA